MKIAVALDEREWEIALAGIHLLSFVSRWNDQGFNLSDIDGTQFEIATQIDDWKVVRNGD